MVKSFLAALVDGHTESGLVNVLGQIIIKVPSPTWIRDLNGHLLFANEAAHKAVGFTDRVVGMHTSEVLSAEDEAALDQCCRRVADTGMRETIDHVFRFREIARIYRISLVPLQQASGEIFAVVGMAVDLTDRIHLEAQLKSEHEALELALMSASAGVGIVDLKTGELWYSQEYLTHFGVDSRVSSLAEWQKRVHPEDLASVLERLNHAIKTGEPLDLLYRYPRSDGTDQWTNTRGQVHYDQNGDPDKLIAICLDVTEQVQGKDATARSEQRFQTFMDQLPALAWIVNRDNEILYCNENVHAMFGADAIGKPVHELLDRRTAETHRVRTDVVLRTGKSLRTQEALPDRWGGVGTYLVTRFPLTEGDVTDRVGVYAIDVTEMVVSREELIRLNTELEERVAERTDRLRRANQELGAFAHGVAHDLRGPLRSLNFYAHALLEELQDSLSPDQVEMLRNQTRTTRRLGAMIDSLLRLAESERSKIQRERVVLGSLIHQVWADLGGNPEAVQILDDGIVEVDHALLGAVFQNLLENSAKFRQPLIALRIEFGWSGHHHAWFYRDNGVSFPREAASRVFEPFARLSETGETEGTGIGLTQVRRIIERHGGRIWADPSPGVGTTFWFTLPQTEMLSESRRETSHPAPAENSRS